MYLISFRSRNSTIGFSRILDKYNFNASVINTPRGISSTCSLSVITDVRFDALKSILLRSNFHDYLGIFELYNKSYVRIF